MHTHTPSVHRCLCLSFSLCLPPSLSLLFSVHFRCCWCGYSSCLLFYSNHSVIILNSLWMIRLVCGGTLNSFTVCCCCWCLFLFFFFFSHSSMVRLFSVVMSRRFYYCLAEGTVRVFSVFSLLLLLLLFFFSLFGFVALFCVRHSRFVVPMQSAVSLKWRDDELVSLFVFETLNAKL